MMKEITNLLEIKEREIRVLLAVHKFCVEHGLSYYLACGSLIGAVRHNGFIPWDDDIDIMMPRKDYEYFINNFGCDEFGVNTYSNNKNYYWSYAKAYDKSTLKIENRRSYKLNQGVDVDIFVLNNCNDVDFALKKEKKRRVIQHLWSLSVRDLVKIKSFRHLIINIMVFFLAPFSRFLARKMDLLAQKDKKRINESCFYQTFSVVGDRIYIFNKEWFDNPILHKFEHYNFYIPSGFDMILKEQFGEYMKLPPIDQQKTHHSNRIYEI